MERRRESDPLPKTSLEMFRKVYGDKTTSVAVKASKGGSARSRRKARLRRSRSQDLHVAEDWQLALRTTVEAAAMGFSPAEVLAASRLIAAKDPLVMRSIGTCCLSPSRFEAQLFSFLVEYQHVGMDRDGALIGHPNPYKIPAGGIPGTSLAADKLRRKSAVQRERTEREEEDGRQRVETERAPPLSPKPREVSQKSLEKPELEWMLKPKFKFARPWDGPRKFRDPNELV